MVWRRAKALAVYVYRSTEEGRMARDFGLRDQMRRASVSVCSNIAEGYERDSGRDMVRFLNIAKGSLAELLTQVEIAGEIGYLPPSCEAYLEKECSEIGKMLGALIKSKQSKIAVPSPQPLAASP